MHGPGRHQNSPFTLPHSSTITIHPFATKSNWYQGWANREPRIARFVSTGTKFHFYYYFRTDDPINQSIANFLGVLTNYSSLPKNHVQNPFLGLKCSACRIFRPEIPKFRAPNVTWRIFSGSLLKSKVVQKSSGGTPNLEVRDTGFWAACQKFCLPSSELCWFSHACIALEERIQCIEMRIPPD